MRQKTYPIIIADCLVYLFCLALFGIVSKEIYILNPFANDIVMTSALIPFVLLVIFGIGFPFYISYKRNHLPLKNPFLILWLIVFLVNLVAISIAPDVFVFSSISANQIAFTPFARFYSIIFAFFIGAIPLLMFHLLPRLILCQKHLCYIFYGFLILIGVLVLVSFITDGENYLIILKSGFSEASAHAIPSFMHKNHFCMLLMLAIFAIIYLDVYKKRWTWLLLFIPILFVELFTFAKMGIFLSALLILAYLIFKLIKVMKKSRDNLVIGSLVIGFILIFASIGVVFIVNSQAGILLRIKNLIVNAFENAKETFASRKIIWDSLIGVLGPSQYLCGFGLAPVSYVIHLVYNFNPISPEKGAYTIHAHNFAIEALGEGGVLFLLLNLTLVIYLFYIALKIRKLNPTLSVVSFLLIITMLLNGMVESLFIMHDGISLIADLLVIVPLMNYYYAHIDQKEIKRRELIYHASLIKSDKWYIKLNNRFIRNVQINIKKERKQINEVA